MQTGGERRIEGERRRESRRKMERLQREREARVTDIETGREDGTGTREKEEQRSSYRRPL